MTAQSTVLRINPTAIFFTVGFIALNFTAMLGAPAAALFLLSTVSLLLRSPGRLTTEFRGATLIWLVVGWSLFTMFWSNVPSDTIRYGIQLAISAAFAVAAASRLSMTTLVRCIMIVSLIVIACSLAFGRFNQHDDWTGIFASKNAFAQFSTIAVISAFAVVIGPGRLGPLRAFGWAGFLLGLLCLVRANSAGALIAAMAALMAMLAFRYLTHFRPVARIFIGLGCGLAVIVAILAVIGYFDAFSAAFLNLTGKDVTLTGRTDLWAVAFDEIAKRPLTGQGYKAFWVEGREVPERLWRQFGIAGKSGFHFHNTLISNAVEIGLIGIALQALIVVSALITLARWAIRSPSFETLFLAGFLVRQFTLMHSEVVFLSQFDPVSILTMMCFVYARRAVRENALAAPSRPAAQPQGAQVPTFTRARPAQ